MLQPPRIVELRIVTQLQQPRDLYHQRHEDRQLRGLVVVGVLEQEILVRERTEIEEILVVELREAVQL